jgi:peptidoglycan/LPS O-acetylase OafA/YrhL
MIRPALSDADSHFLAYLRGIAILVIVFLHVGGGWFFIPYSGFLQVFVPVFFTHDARERCL